MDVFISWSGDQSRKVGEMFAQWLPGVIQECSQPFISTDLGKGEPWFQTITSNLKEKDLGVVFVTLENAASEWLNFEAGALLNKFDKSGVRPVLVDLKKEDYKGPLANLQLTEIGDKQDMLQLMDSLNERCAKPLSAGVLEKAFENSWDELCQSLADILRQAPTSKQKSATRPQADKIDEILNLVRGLANDSAAGDVAKARRPRVFSDSESLRAFEKEYGGLYAVRNSDGVFGEIMAYRKDANGNLMSVMVKMPGEEKKQVLRMGDFSISPF